MTQLRELEQPLRAWRAFRDIAHATRSLSAAQSLHWSHIVRRAEHHASLCREMTDGPPTPKPALRGRIVVAIGSDLGLCGSLNREVSKRAAELHDDETKLAIVIGARLAALDPLPGALVLATPSSFEAVELLGAKLEDLCAALGDPFEFELVLVSPAPSRATPTPRSSCASPTKPPAKPNIRQPCSAPPNASPTKPATSPATPRSSPPSPAPSPPNTKPAGEPPAARSNPRTEGSPSKSSACASSARR